MVSQWWLTSAGTETVFLVFIKVLCRGTPAVPIVTSLCGASIVCLAQKHEGENALGTIAVPIDCVQDCGENNHNTEGKRLNLIHKL